MRSEDTPSTHETKDTTMTKLNRRALCDLAVTQRPITRIPADVRDYSPP